MSMKTADKVFEVILVKHDIWPLGGNNLIS